VHNLTRVKTFISTWDIVAVPEKHLILVGGTDWKKQVGEGMVLQIPDWFSLAFHLRPLADAVVLSILGVSVLIHFRFLRGVPNSDHSFYATSVENILRPSHWEDRTGVASHREIGLDYSFLVVVTLLDLWQAPQFDSAVLWNRRQSVWKEVNPTHVVHMRPQNVLLPDLHRELIVFNIRFSLDLFRASLVFWLDLGSTLKFFRSGILN